MNFFRRHSHLLVVLTLALLGIGLCAWLVPAERHHVNQQLIGFPDSDLLTQHARPYIIIALCFLPLLGSLLYFLGDTLDRYVTREFFQIFSICLSALLVVWLLIDLMGNIGNFSQSQGDEFGQTQSSGGFFSTLFSTIRTIAVFYTSRSPAILLQLLPYSLLLALLYSLGKFSASREMVAIIQSGRGVVRTTLPLTIAGVFFTLFSIGINYHWAPVADARQKEILAEACGDVPTEATNVLYLNQDNHRLWKIGAFPINYEKGAALLNVEVTISNAESELETQLIAPRASWNRRNHKWTFEKPSVVRFQPGHPAEFLPTKDPLVIENWSETPWLLIRPGLNASELGVPDLTTWINANKSASHIFADPSPYITHWHYRWALPFSCLVTVLLAAPLSIHFSRRASSGGIFLAVVLSGLMLLTGNVSIAFGESGTVSPMLAAWLPNLIFTLVALYLFHRRVTGRPIYQSILRLFPSDN